jgi:hypothetical protein
LILAVTLFAEPLVGLAPSEFSDAATLLPLLAAGMIAPRTFRAVNKAADFNKQRRAFVASVVLSALLFIGFALALVPLIGMAGAPLAMLLSFGLSSGYLFYRSQAGKTPMKLPYRSLLGAVLLATACGAPFFLVDPSGLGAQLALALGLLLLYAAVLLAGGIVPRRHRGALLRMGAGLASGLARRRVSSFDPEERLRRLSAEEREQLRMAIIDRASLEELSPSGGNGALVGERIVVSLRRLARRDAPVREVSTEHDARIAEYLFSAASVASRDAVARRLLADGVEPSDLHRLEATVDKLARAPDEAWRGT